MAGSEQRPTDDVEGHGVKFRPKDPRPGDDVEGHMPFRRLDTEAVDEDQVADDIEGHGSRFNG